MRFGAKYRRRQQNKDRATLLCKEKRKRRGHPRFMAEAGAEWGRESEGQQGVTGSGVPEEW